MDPGHGRRFYPYRPRLTPFHIQETEMQESMNFEDSYSPENASAIYRYYLHPDDIATKRNISMYSIQDHHEGTASSKTSPCRFFFGAVLLMSFGAAIAVAVVLAVIMSQPDYQTRYLPPENATYLNNSFLAQKEKGLEKDICKLVDKIFNLKGLSHINRKLDKCDVSLLKKKGNLLVNFAIHIDDTFIEKEADDIKSLVLSNTFNLKTRIDLDFNSSHLVNVTTKSTPSVGIKENASKISIEDHTESLIASNVSSIVASSSEVYFDIDLPSLSVGDDLNDLLFHEEFDYFLPLDMPLDDTLQGNHGVSSSTTVTVSTSSYHENIPQTVTSVSSKLPFHQSNYTLSTIPEKPLTNLNNTSSNTFHNGSKFTTMTSFSFNTKSNTNPVTSLVEETVESIIHHSKLAETNSKIIFSSYESPNSVRPYTSLEVYDDNTLISSYLPLKEGTSLTTGLHTVHFTSSMLDMNTKKADVGTSTYDTFSIDVHHSNWNSQVNDKAFSVNLQSLVPEGSNDYALPIVDISPTKTSHLIPISEEVVTDTNSVHQIYVTQSEGRSENFVNDESVAMKSNPTTVPQLGNAIDVGSSNSILQSSERSMRNSSPSHLRSSKYRKDIFLSPSSESIAMLTNVGNSRIMLSGSQDLSLLGSEILLTSYDISNFDQSKTTSALSDNIHTNNLSKMPESQTIQSYHSTQESLISRGSKEALMASREIGPSSAQSFRVASSEMVLQSQLNFGILKSVIIGANSISVSSTNSMDDMFSPLTFTQQPNATDQQPPFVNIRPSETLSETTDQFIIEQGLRDFDIYLKNVFDITDEEKSLSGIIFSTRKYHETPSHSHFKRESSFDKEESTLNSDVITSHQNSDSSNDFTTAATIYSTQNVDPSSSDLFIPSSVNTYQVKSSYPVNFVHESSVKLSNQTTVSSLYQATSVNTEMILSTVPPSSFSPLMTTTAITGRGSDKANITMTLPETSMKINNSVINVQQGRLQIPTSIIVPNITEKSFDIFNTPRPLTKISVPTFTVSNVTKPLGIHSADDRGNLSSDAVMTRKPLNISILVASNTSEISTDELNNSFPISVHERKHPNVGESPKNTTEQPNVFQGSSAINQPSLNSQSNSSTVGLSLYPNVDHSELNTLFPIKHLNVEGMEADGLTTTPKTSSVDKSVNIDATHDDVKSKPTAGWLQNNGVTLVPQRVKERRGRIATMRGNAGQFLFDAANLGSNFFRMN